jgi:RHS repeat-associated protein
MIPLLLGEKAGMMASVCSSHHPKSILTRLWHQSVTFTSLAALIIATTPNVQAVTCTPVFYYYHSDHLGSSNVITDRAGQEAHRYVDGAYGHQAYSQNNCAVEPSNRYTGQVLDEETGLYFYNARYYDPELGRFIPADTIVPSASDPPDT